MHDPEVVCEEVRTDRVGPILLKLNNPLSGGRDFTGSYLAVKRPRLTTSSSIVVLPPPCPPSICSSSTTSTICPASLSHMQGYRPTLRCDEQCVPKEIIQFSRRSGFGYFRQLRLLYVKLPCSVRPSRRGGFVRIVRCCGDTEGLAYQAPCQNRRAKTMNYTEVQLRGCLRTESPSPTM